MISRCRCKAVLRPARFSPRKRSSAAACRVPSWRSPHRRGLRLSRRDVAERRSGAPVVLFSRRRRLHRDQPVRLYPDRDDPSAAVVHAALRLLRYRRLRHFLGGPPPALPHPDPATRPGFCWNMGRALTAVGAPIYRAPVGVLGSVPMAAVAITASYLIGLTAIWFGPETRGLPLQD